MPATGRLLAAHHHAVQTEEAAERRAACLSCPVRNRTVCAPVTTDAIDRIALLKLPPRRVPAGAAIYAEQGRCTEYFTVLQGWVALSTVQEDGAAVVLDYALPGDFFGFQANPDAPRPQSAIAVTAVEICPFPRAGLEALLQAEPTVAAHLAHLIAAHEARAHDHLVNSAGRDARERVARLLIELYFRRFHRLPQQPDETVTLPLTLALIAETVGLTPVHVSRTLRPLREEGILRFRRGQLHIYDPEALMAAAAVTERPLADAALEG